MKKITLLLSVVMLTACLEPQPKPDLTTRPMSDFAVDTVANNFNTPWSVAPIKDGGYLITEKAGNLIHLDKNGMRHNISGLPNNIFTEGQGGLFDVVLAADFAETGKLYFSYAFGTDAENGTALMEATLGENQLTNLYSVFKASPTKDTSQHFGGRIVVMPDQSLILTLGDGFVYREAAQDKQSSLGKIIRVSPTGAPHPDNPFKSGAEGQVAIYSYGHRNVQGAALDPVTGNLWTHEHGPRGGDELNLITSGGNYGWPLATTGTDYSGSKITPHKTLKDTTSFIHDWVPSIAPSGLTIYKGDMFPNWNGDALVGGLASKDLRRVDLENGKSAGEEILLSDIEARVRDVRTDTDGAVLVLINKRKDGTNGGGALLRITPKQ
ncbi:MAG: PQQ-dependent sugar dehydrogenase [Alphaproteobacteria bacterium]